MLRLFLLKIADDMILLAETPERLQKEMLNSLSNYTLKWNSTRNSEKTNKLFRNEGKVQTKDVGLRLYNGNQLQILNKFNYLGLLWYFIVVRS